MRISVKILEFAFLFFVFAGDRFLRSQLGEQIVRFDLFPFGKQPRIGAEHFNEGMNLRFGRFFELDQVVAFFGGKEVVGVNRIEFRVDSVDAADALNQSCRIPRDVVVKDDV